MDENTMFRSESRVLLSWRTVAEASHSAQSQMARSICNHGALFCPLGLLRKKDHSKSNNGAGLLTTGTGFWRDTPASRLG